MSEQGPLNEFLAEVDSGAFERQLTRLPKTVQALK